MQLPFACGYSAGRIALDKFLLGHNFQTNNYAQVGMRERARKRRAIKGKIVRGWIRLVSPDGRFVATSHEKISQRQSNPEVGRGSVVVRHGHEESAAFHQSGYKGM